MCIIKHAKDLKTYFSSDTLNIQSIVQRQGNEAKLLCILFPVWTSKLPTQETKVIGEWSSKLFDATFLIKDKNLSNKSHKAIS